VDTRSLSNHGTDSYALVDGVVVRQAFAIYWPLTSL
jgi:hypothetical protein